MNRHAASPPCYSRWANRSLIVSLMGIVYFTLFPFRFDFSATSPVNRSPFLLGPAWKYHAFIDFFLNVLLFVPFGFGLVAESRKRSRNWATGLLLALAGGFLISYTIEFLQLYIPSRDSGWDDVSSNTLGSVGGFFLFEFCGAAIFRQFSRIEDALERWMALSRASLVLLIYLGAWFGASIPLQHQTRLSDWEVQSRLIIGNDASGRWPWSGQISRVQIWSKALTEKSVQQLSGPDRVTEGDPDSELLAGYEFAGPQQLPGYDGAPPALVWQTGAPFVATASDLRLDGKSWLSTKSPVSDLVRRIGQTSEFTLRVTCSPANVSHSSGQIVSISESGDDADLSLRQIGPTLGFWFRNPLSEDRSALSWSIPNVFSALESKDIFITYDGSEAVAYLNGRKLPQRYQLSAGASLAHQFSFIRTVSLPGYEVLYSTFIFLPAGMLIGLAARNHARKTFARFLLGFFLFAPPILLELQLTWLGHRAISLPSVLTSVVLACVGLLFINADRRQPRPGVPVSSS